MITQHLNHVCILIILFIYYAKSDECYCYLDETLNETTNLIQCSFQPNNNSTFRIPCQRVENFISVGPLNVTNLDNIIRQTSINKPVEFSPWAFINLFTYEHDQLNALQLDINLRLFDLNALHMAGLNKIQTIQARRALFNYDNCVFADLAQLKDVTLNCKAGYPHFLTFNSSLNIVRFVGCDDVGLQFYCIQCRQDPTVNVIRIRPGPPLKQHLVKLSHFRTLDPLPSSSTTTTLKEDANRLNLNNCVLDICSDEMLCRTNSKLHKARQKIGMPLLLTTTTTTGTPTTTEIAVTSSIYSHIRSNVTGDGFDNTDVVPTGLDDVSTNNTTSQTLSVASLTNHSDTEHKIAIPGESTEEFKFNHKIWIVSCIMILILISLFTACIVIRIKQQHVHRRRVKYMRARQQPSISSPPSPPSKLIQTNGTAHLVQITTAADDTEIKIELPEIA